MNQLFGLPGLQEHGLDLCEGPPNLRGVFLEGGLIKGHRKRVLAAASQLIGDLDPQADVVGAKLGELGELGRRLVVLARGRVVIREILVDLQRIGRFLELCVGSLDELL